MRQQIFMAELQEEHKAKDVIGGKKLRPRGYLGNDDIGMDGDKDDVELENIEEYNLANKVLEDKKYYSQRYPQQHWVHMRNIIVSMGRSRHHCFPNLTFLVNETSMTKLITATTETGSTMM